MKKRLTILQIRSEFRDNGPGTQSLEIAREMRRRGHNTIFASSGGILAEEIRKEFKHIDIPTLAINKRGPVSTIKNIIKIRKILKEENIDVIHGHNAAAAFTSYLASKTVNRKVAITHSVRGMEIRKGYQWRNFIYRLYPATFFAVSDFTKQMLIRAGVREDRIINTYNGVDTEKFDISKCHRDAFRNEIGTGEDTVLIGTVGRVNYNKGQEVLIKAIPYILKKTSNFKVVIVGDGERLEACKELARDLGVEEFVHFTGFRRDIPNIQAALDIYTLASVKGEMFPNSILEAMAMGNPWVASKLSGIPEISENGKNGLLVQPNNCEDLADKLSELIINEILRKNMGKNCIKTVYEKYTIKKVCDAIEYGYLNAFNQLI
ncbi:MAG TPA: glycosyltransferase family 4 protein [Acetivibrio sp.]|uniref:glycosyltransferase family 4 protein n=1 Tax=Acetivibrio sp. TaxID=1872092 RepID=UPI002C6811A0|nr:glycosyltransferase family 4 protein [Acetivibrio sp.]HOM02486.1 glycosyltransferase family 4 protein [Acetivibrio sp.]